MPTYKAPVEDVLFLLADVFQVGRYDNLPGFADASPDVIAAILGEAAKFCEQVLAPLNRVGDVEGCTRHDDGRSPRRPGSATPSGSMPKAAGRAYRRPPSSAARACRRR